MAWKKWICGTMLVAAPILLLTQCMSNDSQPTAPMLSAASAATNCAAKGRNLEILSPPLSGPLCKGQCTRITWRVLNPCGDYTTFVEGWYDGVWVELGAVRNENWIHWDSPGGIHAKLAAQNSVKLRLVVIDGAGLLGMEEVNLGPLLPAPPPPRPAQEFD